jgi:hypothetical protein
MVRAAGGLQQVPLARLGPLCAPWGRDQAEKHQDRCDNRFDRRTKHAIKRYGADECTSIRLLGSLADRTISHAEAVATEASGAPVPSRHGLPLGI